MMLESRDKDLRNGLSHKTYSFGSQMHRQLDKKFTLLARAGRQVQEIQLTTLLDQEGIKKALQRVLERVP
ncbi:hypothetical protein Patl1_26128 [Pistacia atlantica]|uniref:Uncharacterized protein n=1 Tax=Pistacia atlantica TaxID=434234 RepID=A0ACC1B1Q8_9ROSI|nr:hypothetical protein Patl1_26128 [Pistacia atlantica]